MKKLLWIIGVIAVLAVAYLVGPKPKKTNYNMELPVYNESAIELTEKIIASEKARGDVRPRCESMFYWANDSAKNKTDYALLYLHGFSASMMEGYPAHIELAKAFGWNLYVPRLHGHGLVTEDALIDMTPENLYESSKEAMVVARKLGKKLIIIGTSTGGTLALKLAADFPELVDGLILYSPNIKIRDAAAVITDDPWGLQITRQIVGGKHRFIESMIPEQQKYWYQTYRCESIVYLQQLLTETMTSKTFKAVTCPTFIGYYYKDAEHQDETVSVDAILEMALHLGTPSEKLLLKPFPEAGDHVIASEVLSGCVQEVFDETELYIKNVILTN